MYLIVVGAGDTGRSLVDLAVQDGNDVVVIESEDDRASRLSEDYDCLVLNADATTHGTLEDAGVDRADAVISTTDVDAVNTMVMLLAQEHGVPNLLSVVHEPQHLPVFEKIGVNVIENPQRLIAEFLYHSVQHPNVADFVELEDGTDLVGIDVDEGAPIEGLTLADAKSSDVLPGGSLVVALKGEGEELHPPDGDTTLRAGDAVELLVDEEDLDRALDAFEGA